MESPFVERTLEIFCFGQTLESLDLDRTDVPIPRCGQNPGILWCGPCEKHRGINSLVLTDLWNHLVWTETWNPVVDGTLESPGVNFALDTLV